MRSKKALTNIVVSLLLQIVGIICGLIVPRLIINTFGSSVNGLVSSITQFLGYIVLLEAGVGGVVRAALYKPLSDKDVNSISGIVKATEKFFRAIAAIFLLYLLIIAFIFPYLVSNDFNNIFTFTLVLIIGISTIFQYYFGISYQILLQADQRQYITSVIQIITMIINTTMVVMLIKLGAGIHYVKLASSIIFIVRPMLLRLYITRKYKLIKDCDADNDAIKQRWDGLGHHIAFLIHNNTDITLLALFTNINEVSVYTVYLMVISSVKKLTVTFSSGLEAAFGNMIAKDEKEVLNRNLRIFELSSFVIVTILFTSTALLIMPFISLYTKGVTDVNYYRPTFAYVLIAAEAAYCIRVPYNAVVLAAGHYKQTKNGAFVEALINIVLSLILINNFGMIGVAIGTLFAMLFRTIQYAMYLSANIIKRSILVFVKRILIYSVSSLIIVILFNILPPVIIDTYSKWILYAIEVTVIASVVTFIISSLFYLDDIKNFVSIIKRMIKRKQI